MSTNILRPTKQEEALWSCYAMMSRFDMFSKEKGLMAHKLEMLSNLRKYMADAKEEEEDKEGEKVMKETCRKADDKESGDLKSKRMVVIKSPKEKEKKKSSTKKVSSKKKK